MGPALIVPVVAGGIIAKNAFSKKQVADPQSSSILMGGKLKHFNHANLLNIKQKLVEIDHLDQYLRENGIPEDQINEAAKLKTTQIGKLQILKFSQLMGDFKAMLIMIKSVRKNQTTLQLSIRVDNLAVTYQNPAIKYLQERGARTEKRGLTADEIDSLRIALINKIEQTVNKQLE